MRLEIAIALLLSLGVAALAHADPPRGHDDYIRYCAACHGHDADGKGPVANVLEPSPPDLTALSKKYGRPLGTKFVTYVMGTTMPRAHGTSDMPVWGRNLRVQEESGEGVVETIWRIASYLDSIQQDAIHHED